MQYLTKIQFMNKIIYNLDKFAYIVSKVKNLMYIYILNEINYTFEEAYK